MSEDKEFLEVETDYDRGVMDERKRWEAKTCNGCKHQPLQGENYYDPCGDCKRFYADHYEPKDSQ